MTAPLAVAADSTHMCWIAECDDTVNRMPRDGGASETLGDRNYPEATVADEVAVVWGNGLDLVMLVK